VQYFCSWSGGKDSCLALRWAIGQWGPPACLFTMLAEDGEHSRSHGLTPEVLRAQAEALGVPIDFGAATWGDYEAVYVQHLIALRAQGIEAGVFGDMDTEAHRAWEESVCRQAGMSAHLPLWQADRRALVQEFLAAGFEALIVTVDLRHVPERFLGRPFDAVVEELEALGVDVSGEGGEFHTCVIGGPLFAHPIRCRQTAVRHQSDYAMVELRL